MRGRTGALRGRRLSGFDRAILRAETFREQIDGEDVRGILIPAELASGFQAGFETGHSRRSVGGTWFVTDEATRAAMVIDTIDGLGRGGADASETFRRRVAILRRLLTAAEWDEAFAVHDQVRALLDPRLEPSA